MANLLASIASIASNNSQTAVIVPSEVEALTITYQQLIADVRSFQSKLAALGVGAGSAVSIALPNSYEFVVAFLAASSQRAIAAPLNPGYKQAEFEFYIGDLSSVIVLVPQHDVQRNEAVFRAARTYSAAIAECYWDGHGIALDIIDDGKLAELGAQQIQTARLDDVALVLHTSGTTGKPKAVSACINLPMNISNKTDKIFLGVDKVPLTHQNLIRTMGM